MHRKTENLLYSAGGLVAAFLILALLNFVLGAARWRIDLTQGKLYTLSEGTRAVLGKLEFPVKIRLYFSQSDIPLPIKAYGRRVEDVMSPQPVTIAPDASPMPTPAPIPMARSSSSPKTLPTARTSAASTRSSASATLPPSSWSRKSRA